MSTSTRYALNTRTLESFSLDVKWLGYIGGVISLVFWALVHFLWHTMKSTIQRDSKYQYNWGQLPFKCLLIQHWQIMPPLSGQSSTAVIPFNFVLKHNFEPLRCIKRDNSASLRTLSGLIFPYADVPDG